MSTPTYLRRKDSAKYLKDRYGVYTEEYLAKLACVGGGPRFRKLGKFPLYRPEDLDLWAMSRMSGPVLSTSELGNADSKSTNRRRA